MKKLLLFTLINLFSFSLLAQEAEETENPITFHIKIGTWEKLPKDVKKLIKIGEVEVVTVNKGSRVLNTVFTLDAYDCYNQASKQIKKYIDRGYPDSFVIAFDRGQRISKEEALEKTKTICK